MLSLADAISAARAALAPALLLAGASERRTLALTILAAGLATDILDGAVARKLGPVSPRGAHVDSCCDIIFYGSAAIALMLLFPQLVRSHPYAIATMIVSYVLPIAYGWLKFRTLTSYHTLLSRASLGALTASVAWFVVTDRSALLPYAAFVFALAGLDELRISMLLTAPRANVRSSPIVLTLIRRITHADP